MAKQNYHHGDLHASLLNAALELLEQQGVDGLSMRKLADRAQVSRTAPYHHFKDKHALLCELAMLGFSRYQREVHGGDQGEGGTGDLKSFVSRYLVFATENPELYELMFGRLIWKSGDPTAELQEESHQAFRSFVLQFESWQQAGVLPPGHSALRMTQVAWSSLHGLALLVINGVYQQQTSIEEICQTLVSLLLSPSVADD